MIHVGFISTVGRLRDVDQDQVARLAESIKEVGLLNPITVYRREIIRNGQTVEGYGLVAGAHRLEACKRLGWQEVPAVVVDLDDDDRIIAECDENLCGTKVSATEQAMFTAKRKEAYLRKHPETGHGKATADKEDNLSSFDKDQADKTGVDARTVRRNAERGEKVTPEALAMVKGTKLDTGAYLDKLKKVAPEKQIARVERDLAEAAKPKEREQYKRQAKVAETNEPHDPVHADKLDADSAEPEDPATAKLRAEARKLSRDALEEEWVALRLAVDEQKAKRKKAEADATALKAQLADITADDKTEVIRRQADKIRNSERARFQAEEKAAAALRQVHALKKEMKRITGQEFVL